MMIMIHLEQNCATICQSPCMSWRLISVSYDHDHDPRSSFFIATLFISLHVFSSMINTIPIRIWPAPEDDEQGSLPSSHEFFVPTMTEPSKKFWKPLTTLRTLLPYSEMSFANSGHQMFNLVKSTWRISWKVVCDGCSRMGLSGCKNWLEESCNCAQNEAGDVEIKDCKTASKMKKSGRSRNIITMTQGGESISIW